MSATQPTVREYMTPNPVTIDGGLSVSDASTRMFQINARHLPVYVSGHLVGILSDRDLARISAVDGFESHTSTAEQACTPNPYVVGPDVPIAEVVKVLVRQKFGAALVMEGGKLLGMFTVIDALRALIALLRPVSPDLGFEDFEVVAAGAADDTDDRTPDARHEALLNSQSARGVTHTQSQGVRVGIDAGISTDIRSEAGQRSDMRRAATTVYGRDPKDDKSGS